MTQLEVYQLFSEWFDSAGFASMTDAEKISCGMAFLLDIATTITKLCYQHSSNYWKSTTTNPAKSGQHQASVALWIMRVRRLIRHWEKQNETYRPVS